MAGRAELVEALALYDGVAPTAPRDSTDPLDVSGARDLSYLLNEVFFEAICAGKLDDGLNLKPQARPDLACLDFIGVNYYETVTVDGVASAPLGGPAPSLPGISHLRFVVDLSPPPSSPRTGCAGSELAVDEPPLDRARVVDDQRPRQVVHLVL